MKTLKTRPKYLLINLSSLALIYGLLSLLTYFFSRTFLRDILEDGKLPDPVTLGVFMVIPGALAILVAISGLGIVRDALGSRPGSRFQLRLLAYFTVIVFLTAAPVILVTGITVGEAVRFVKTLRVDNAMDAALTFAAEFYSLRLEQAERSLAELRRAGGRGGLPEGVAAAQVFSRREDGAWEETAFTGDRACALTAPPQARQGYASRELPRDRDMVRHVETLDQGRTLRVATLSLGQGFDAALEDIESERGKFAIIDTIRFNLRSLLIFYYGVFFLPILLMALIIAVSLSRRITSPIKELSDATRRVAEGDFSIQILPGRRDELGHLVTSFNAMVRELQSSRDALLRTEKISIWQTMAQQLAHEIKNPLTPIKLTAERVLRRQRNDPAALGEIVEPSMLAIIQEVDGLSTLLNEFRTFSRPMEAIESSINLKDLLEEVISPYRASYPKVRFDTEKVPAGVSLKIDKNRMTQVFTNLIINSIDAMQGEGLIEIRSDLVKKQETWYCRISMRDTGKGISREDREKIFIPYFTTKDKGTGLGLPIVERIVNEHGGAIWFNSAEGEGSTFFIDMPLDTKGEA